MRPAVGLPLPFHYKGGPRKHGEPHEHSKNMSDAAPIEHRSGLTVGDFTAADEPLRLFGQWLEDATQSEPADPNAMAVATVDSDGLPDLRMVLMKGFDERGFVFYTNMDSQKGRELDATPKAALLFHWKSKSRQVRLRGPVERVSDGSPAVETDAGDP